MLRLAGALERDGQLAGQGREVRAVVLVERPALPSPGDVENPQHVRRRPNGNADGNRDGGEGAVGAGMPPGFHRGIHRIAVRVELLPFLGHAACDSRPEGHAGLGHDVLVEAAGRCDGELRALLVHEHERYALRVELLRDQLDDEVE